MCVLSQLSVTEFDVTVNWILPNILRWSSPLISNCGLLIEHVHHMARRKWFLYRPVLMIQLPWYSHYAFKLVDMELLRCCCHHRIFVIDIAMYAIMSLRLFFSGFKELSRLTGFILCSVWYTQKCHIITTTSTTNPYSANPHHTVPTHCSLNQWLSLPQPSHNLPITLICNTLEAKVLTIQWVGNAEKCFLFWED